MPDLSFNDLKLIQNTSAPVLKFIFAILIAVHTDVRDKPFQFTGYSHSFLHEIILAAVTA
jgi:hypothetical protein